MLRPKIKKYCNNFEKCFTVKFYLSLDNWINVNKPTNGLKILDPTNENKTRKIKKSGLWKRDSVEFCQS